MGSALAVAACAPEPDAPPSAWTVGSLTVTRAVAPAPIASSETSLYLTIFNTGTQPDSLTTLASPIAERVSLHRMDAANGMMRMTEIPHLVIPVRDSVVLEPGRLHGMFEALARTIHIGDTVVVNLTFANAGMLEVAVPVVGYAEVEGELRGR